MRINLLVYMGLMACVSAEYGVTHHFTHEDCTPGMEIRSRTSTSSLPGILHYSLDPLEFTWRTTDHAACSSDPTIVDMDSMDGANQPVPSLTCFCYHFDWAVVQMVKLNLERHRSYNLKYISQNPPGECAFRLTLQEDLQYGPARKLIQRVAEERSDDDGDSTSSSQVDGIIDEGAYVVLLAGVIVFSSVVVWVFEGVMWRGKLY